jgi:hypothetical protein
LFVSCGVIRDGGGGRHDDDGLRDRRDTRDTNRKRRSAGTETDIPCDHSAGAYRAYCSGQAGQVKHDPSTIWLCCRCKNVEDRNPTLLHVLTQLDYTTDILGSPWPRIRDA